MAEKPILFNTEMVKAILDGRKTQTRRLIQPQPQSRLAYCYAGTDSGTWGYPTATAHEFWGADFELPRGLSESEKQRRWKPPCEADDILWVRETWRPVRYVRPVKAIPVDFKETCFEYKADGIARSDGKPERWHPSIHMSREAARLFLLVKKVRIERLQEMTEDDASAEGYGGWPWCYHKVFENYPDSPIPCVASDGRDCPVDRPCDHSIPELFGREVWEKTIKTADIHKFGWDANPWVWVIEFEKMKK